MIQYILYFDYKGKDHTSECFLRSSVLPLPACKKQKGEMRYPPGFTPREDVLISPFSFYISYTTPCCIIARATFMKPAMFAPLTKLR